MAFSASHLLSSYVHGVSSYALELPFLLLRHGRSSNYLPWHS